MRLWVQEESKLFDFKGSKARKKNTGDCWRCKESHITSRSRHGLKATMGGQGRKSMIPFKGDIIAYMSERRDNNKFVRVFHLMQWIRRNQKPWLTPKSLCVELSQEVLDSVWLGYAVYFHTKYAAYPKHTILNADETGPPGAPG
ncbi:hypothetical protein B5M09_012331 [Aphanomyces astaci]|uniref:PiggyBac transposable element-derived protein domain-containing protein n=1 Tax=Aphanomyces astaci TaxID=112090 RepID=A0A425DN10_APHAT|nr:hypothetical protein B5M09_012331 [Aphanomyces astaci]